MITLTKLCRSAGLSRKILQDYDRLGLLKHCAETPGGYWLYEEDALDRLALIQLLRHAGYTRQELLPILDPPDAPISVMLDMVQTALQCRQHQIDQLLHRVELMRLKQEEPTLKAE